LSSWILVLHHNADDVVGLAGAITPLNAATMTCTVRVGGGVEFCPTAASLHYGGGDDYFGVTSATARLDYYPRDTLLQRVIRLDVAGGPFDPIVEVVAGDDDDPDGYVGGGSSAFDAANRLEMHWDDPPGPYASFEVTAVVVTANEEVRVRDRIPFPLSKDSIAPEARRYLATGRIADRGAEIDRLARSLVSGADDLYHAVFALADWVTTNVEYSLASEATTTTTKGGVNNYEYNNIQTASQVLRSRYGKCDELTALFVSLVRAVGVPARVVEGYSYAEDGVDMQFGEHWGPHAWAEVYFPGRDGGGYMWVPFDVTDGEYGRLHAGHVAMRVTDDVAAAGDHLTASAVMYDVRGWGDFETFVGPVVTEVRPDQMTPHRQRLRSGPSVDIVSLDPSHGEVGFDSAVALFAEVVNLEDHYVCARLDFAKAVGSELLGGDAVTNVLLNPGEARTIPFLVRIPAAEPGRGGTAAYEFPFSLSSAAHGAVARTTIRVCETARDGDNSILEDPRIRSYFDNALR